MHPSRFDPPLPVLLLLTGLFVLALQVRLMGIGWDAWASLHPDERHMVFVTLDMMRGASEARAEGIGLSRLWFGPDSPLDPRLAGRLHVYGEFPPLLVAGLGLAFGQPDWGWVLWIGRSLSAMIDASVVIAVVIGALKLKAPPGAALAAGLLYALAPTALQLSIFFTVDAWLSGFAAWALLALIALAGPGGHWRHALLAGLLTGLAAACKVTAIGLAPAGLLALLLFGRRCGARQALLAAGIALGSAFLLFRLVNPFAFSGPGLFGLAISPRLLANFAELPDMLRGDGIPPSWQWQLPYPPFALLRDLALFGTGPMLMLLAPLGLGLALRRPKGAALAVLLAALAGHLAAVLHVEVPFLRYFAPALPLLAMLAAPALAALPRPALVLSLGIALWWGAGVLRLHDGRHPRLEATLWLAGLPAGTRLGFETGWDETLPLSFFTPPGQPGHQSPGPFVQEPLRLTDPDTPQSPAELAAALARAEYVVISSGRQIEVMPRLPARFPTVSRYYRALDAGALCYEPAFHRDRGFPLPFWRLDDRFAQESWRVYTHPVVSIWRRLPCYEPEAVRRLLTGPPG